MKKIKKSITWEGLINNVASYSRVTVNELMGRSRSRKIVEARTALIFMATKYLGYNQVQISKRLTITPSGVNRLCRKGEEMFRGNEATIGGILKISQ